MGLLMGGDLACESPLYLMVEEKDDFCSSPSQGLPTFAESGPLGVSAARRLLGLTHSQYHPELCGFVDEQPAPGRAEIKQLPCPLEEPEWCDACAEAQSLPESHTVRQTCEEVCKTLDNCWWKSPRQKETGPTAACSAVLANVDSLSVDEKEELFAFAAAIDTNTDPQVRSSSLFRCLRPFFSTNTVCCNCQFTHKTTAGATLTTQAYTPMAVNHPVHDGEDCRHICSQTSPSVTPLCPLTNGQAVSRHFFASSTDATECGFPDTTVCDAGAAYIL